MTREEYQSCLKPYISGHHEDRKLDFCIGAKVCSKGISQDEAGRLCSLPKEQKEPKLRKSRAVGKSCSPQSLNTMAACLLTRINFSATDMEKELRDNLASCMCGGKEKKVSKAEQAVLALDPEQRIALAQFMEEHGTSAKK